ncbi:MAG: hypothetical protein WCB04_03225 [Mycobacteriales bacterium]
MTEISRRRLLQLAAGGAAIGTAGLLFPASPASAHGDLQTYSGVWGQPTVYEANGNLTSFAYRPSFHDRMATWLEFWFDNTGLSVLKPMRVWTLGVHTDDRSSEAHNNGRGFDLTRIYATNQQGNLHRQFFGRYDQWKDDPAADMAATRVHYWATSASLHYHFRNVLTYPYNSDHWNHIHIDNLVSGLGNSDFDTSSEAQTLHVQASCRFVWGKATTVDGVWGPETNTDSTQVLRRIGRASGTIASSQANWLAFNKATLRKGYDVEQY